MAIPGMIVVSIKSIFDMGIDTIEEDGTAKLIYYVSVVFNFLVVYIVASWIKWRRNKKYEKIA